MDEPLFEVNDLKVAYRRPGHAPLMAVKGVSFTLQAGETLGIVGESGSGKSTIAKALLLLLPVAGGTVRFRGQDITRFNAAARSAYRRDVQMVFQDAVGSLNPRMTIRQALAEALNQTVPGESRRTPRELLDVVGLSEAVLDQYPRELSGGQCQRASFARALAVNPKVLVADEPVSALDVSVQARILNLLRDLRRNLNLAVILVAHDLAVVRNVCDRVCVMNEGLFVDAGPAEDVFAAAPGRRARRGARPGGAAGVGLAARRSARAAFDQVGNLTRRVRRGERAHALGHAHELVRVLDLVEDVVGERARREFVLLAFVRRAGRHKRLGIVVLVVPERRRQRNEQCRLADARQLEAGGRARAGDDEVRRGEGARHLVLEGVDARRDARGDIAAHYRSLVLESRLVDDIEPLPLPIEGGLDERQRGGGQLVDAMRALAAARDEHAECIRRHLRETLTLFDAFAHGQTGQDGLATRQMLLRDGKRNRDRLREPRQRLDRTSRNRVRLVQDDRHARHLRGQDRR